MVDSDDQSDRKKSRARVKREFFLLTNKKFGTNMRITRIIFFLVNY